MGRTYDPKTGTWKNTGGGEKKSTKTNKKKSTKKNTTKKDTKKKSTKKKDTKKKSTTTKAKSNKKKSASSFNYFTAKLKLRPTASTMKIKAANTISISGVGSYLGGKFYVQDVTYTLDGNGLALEVTLIKVGFSRDSVKPKHKTKSKKKSSKKKTQAKIHKVKKGETLLSICKKYFKKKSKKVQKSHLNKMKKKNKIKNEKKKLKVGRKIYIV